MGKTKQKQEKYRHKPKGNKRKTHNRQYYKRRAAAFVSILEMMKKARGRVTVIQLSKVTNFPRQTFYRYFRNVNQAIIECEQWLHQEYGQYLAKISPDNTDEGTNRKLFLHTFIFMSQNKKLFNQVCSNMAVQDILYRMLMNVLYPKLRLTWLPKGDPAPSIDSGRVDIYLRVLTGVICQWGKETQCDINKADQYIRKMLKVTEDVTRRNFF